MTKFEILQANKYFNENSYYNEIKQKTNYYYHLMKLLILFLAITIGETASITTQALPPPVELTRNSYLKRWSTQENRHVQQHYNEIKNNNNNNVDQCGYRSCPKIDENKINVHLIAHSHDDVGWLKTIDQYYYGNKKQIAPFGVQYILDSVIQQLALDSRRKFVYVEMAFFQRWWMEQNEQTRQLTRKLVNNGQLEFINGGWCMNDEATTSYSSIIDQMTLGLRFLNDTFGSCAVPRVGWQIDPFGHSSEQASLFAQFGFDGMYFSRIDYRDKDIRALESKRALDLIWHGDIALANDFGSIYTNVFHDHYEAPNTFCFDVYCLDDQLVDNRNSYEFNIDERVSSFAGYIGRHAKRKRTNHILIPMGGDFAYTSAWINFKNMDKLIEYVNKQRPHLNVFYSTPNCYQQALNQYQNQHKNQSNLNNSSDNFQNYELKSDEKFLWPEKIDDFFPYASDIQTYWSGYFTSRPSIKLFERQTWSLLQIVRQISLMSQIKQLKQIKSKTKLNLNHNFTDESRKVQWQRDDENCLKPLWKVSGDLQHHDAITGTEKQVVTSDYMRRTTDAILGCISLLRNARHRIEFFSNHQHNRQQQQDNLTNSLAVSENVASFPQMQDWRPRADFCVSLNITRCDLVESYLHGDQSNNAILVSIFNPLAQYVLDYDIRLPCPGNCDLSQIKIVNLENEKQPVTAYVAPLTAGVNKIKYRKSNSNVTIAFLANLPPAGYSNYMIQLIKKSTLENEQSLLEKDKVIHVSSSSSQLRVENLSPQQTNKEKIRQRKESNLNLKMNQDDQQWTVINSKKKKEEKKFEWLWKRSDNIKLDTKEQDLRVVIDLNKGSIERFVDPKTNETIIELSHTMGWYYSASSSDGRASGAYIFRPKPESTVTILSSPQKFKIVQLLDGQLLELHQQWNEWIYSTLRLSTKFNYIDFDYVVGPIPLEKDKENSAPVRVKNDSSVETSQPSELASDNDESADGDPLKKITGTILQGREVISRFSLNLKTDGVFYTDSNGRQLVPRVLNSVRPRTVENITIDDSNEPVASNYFPITSTILLRGQTAVLSKSTMNDEPVKDNEQKIYRNYTESKKSEMVDFAVLVDRPQAATSLEDGQIDILLHRRCTVDDNFGVGEPLNEPGEDGRGLVVRGQHRVFFYRHSQFTNDNWLMQTKLDRPEFKLLNDPIVNRLRIDSNRFHMSPRLLFDIIPSSEQLQTIDNNNNILDYVERAQSQVLRTNDEIRYDNYGSTSSSLHEYDDEFESKISGRTRETRAINNDQSEFDHKMNEFSLLNNSLPANINLLTLMQLSNDELLLRLENLDSPLMIHQDLFPKQVFDEIIASYPIREPGREIEAPVQETNVGEIIRDENNNEKTIEQTAGELMDAKCKLARGHHYQRNIHKQIERHWCTSRLQEFKSLMPAIDDSTPSSCLSSSSYHTKNTQNLINTYIVTEFLIKDIRITELTELALGANIELNQINRMKWNTKSSDNESNAKDNNGREDCRSGRSRVKSTLITLGPRQIKTFIVKYSII